MTFARIIAAIGLCAIAVAPGVLADAAAALGAPLTVLGLVAAGLALVLPARAALPGLEPEDA